MLGVDPRGQRLEQPQPPQQQQQPNTSAYSYSYNTNNNNRAPIQYPPEQQWQSPGMSVGSGSSVGQRSDNKYYSDRELPQKPQLRRSSSMRSLKKWVRRKFGPPESRYDHDGRMYQYNNSLQSAGYTPIMAQSPQQQQQLFTFEQHVSANGTHPPHVNGSQSAAASSSHSDYDSGLERTPSSEKMQPAAHAVAAIPLLQGIANHGNTCYMAAVLQCLASTDALAHYFLSDEYKIQLQQASESRLRNQRKFGTGGALTKELARMLRVLWLNEYLPQHSLKFRHTVAHFGSMYDCHLQQDAAEFFTWLIDKVHEDLNIASQRNFRQKSVADYTSEDEFAEDTLSRYRKAHCSFMTRLFEAQLRSSVVCPRCSQPKINFEPYQQVSLQVPQNSQRPVFITLCYSHRLPRLTLLGLNADCTATLHDICSCLADNVKINANNLVCVELNSVGYESSWRARADVQQLHGNHLHVVELPDPTSLAHDHIQCVVINATGHGHLQKRLGHPFVARVSRDSTYERLASRLLSAVKTQLKVIPETVPLSALRLRVFDNYSGSTYLDPSVAMPLYTQTIDQLLELHDQRVLFVTIEWVTGDWSKFVHVECERISEHASANTLRQQQASQRPSSLYKALNEYTKTETLNDAYTCRKCHATSLHAKKSIQFWTLPDVLVFHFKRFKQAPDGRLIKLEPLIEFPVAGLDMSGFGNASSSPTSQPSSAQKNGLTHSNIRSPSSPSGAEGSQQYDLFAVCYHVGDSIDSGHYTAACKNPVDQQWRLFDDARVSAITDQSKLQASTAYMLFYQRRSSGSTCSHVPPKSSAESGFSEHWWHECSRSLAGLSPQRPSSATPLHQYNTSNGNGNHQSAPVRRSTQQQQSQQQQPVSVTQSAPAASRRLHTIPSVGSEAHATPPNKRGSSILDMVVPPSLPLHMRSQQPQPSPQQRNMLLQQQQQQQQQPHNNNTLPQQLVPPPQQQQKQQQQQQQRNGVQQQQQRLTNTVANNNNNLYKDMNRMTISNGGPAGGGRIKTHSQVETDL